MSDFAYERPCSVETRRVALNSKDASAHLRAANEVNPGKIEDLMAFIYDYSFGLPL
jgi:hypothetical protein